MLCGVQWRKIRVIRCGILISDDAKYRVKQMEKEENFVPNSRTAHPALPFFGADVVAENARTS